MLLLLVFLILILPLGVIFTAYLENFYPRQDELPDYIKGLILLGGSFHLRNSFERKIICYNIRAGRVIKFVELAQLYPNLPLIFAGNGLKKSNSKYSSESELASILFKNLNLDMKRITFENHSYTTQENAVFSFNLIKPQPDECWALVTSAVHMPRAVLCFRQAGWTILPYPVDFQTDGQMKYKFQGSLLKYFITWYLGVWEGLALISLKFRK